MLVARVVAALAAAFVALGGAATAAEQPAAQLATELGLAATVGYDGRAGGGSWQPVAVTLEPVRPVAGTLSITIAGNFGTSSEVVPVEVAAASRKDYRFIVPAGRVTVSFAEEGAEPVTIRPQGADAGFRGGEYLVGLIGDSVDGLPPLRSEVTGSTGAWVPVPAQWLDESAFALEPLSAVVVEADALGALGPQARRNLVAGVAAGTDLVVAGFTDVDVDGLGLPWEVPENAWGLNRDAAEAVPAGDPPAVLTATAGYGRMALTPVTPGAAGAGRSAAFWSLLAQPGDITPAQGNEYRVWQTPYQFARILATPGGNAPALPWLGGFVAVYVLVVGPINALVLARMGRRELAWATVPLVTVIFTSGAFFGATTGRPPGGGATRLTYWTDGAGVEVVAAGARAATPGVRSLRLPGSGWMVRPLVDGGQATTVTRGEDTTVSMDLTALQLGGLAAWKATDAPPPLEVTARATSRGVSVTVVNVSDRALTDVVVRAATATRSLAELAAGAEHKVVIRGARLPQASAYRDPFEGLPGDVNGVVGPPLSLRSAVNGEVAPGQPGIAWVSAVDPGAAPTGVAVGSEPTIEHGGMVAVGEPIASGDRLSPFAVAREAVLDTNEGYRPGPESVEGAGQVFLRFRLPPGARASELTDELGRSNQSGGRADLTVWDHDAEQWVSTSEAFDAGRRASIVGPLGDIWARASGEHFPFEYSARTVAGGDAT